MKKIDFLFLIDNINLQGGTEIQTLNIVHALNDSGHHAKIFSITPCYEKKDYIISLTQSEYIKYTKKKNSIINKICYERNSDFYIHNILENYINEIQPKILVNQTYDLIHILPFNLNIKIIQVLNWSILGYENSILEIIKKKKGVIKYLSQKVNSYKVELRHSKIKDCSSIIILTESAKNELKKINQSIKDSQIKIIPNPLRKTTDSQHISTLNNHNITFVGRLSHEKGVIRLLKIWKSISQFLPEYTLSIYGQGDAKKDMEKFISDNKLKNIIFHGFEKDISKIYISSDLLLSTSDSEGFGLVFIEAFYYGVPAISFDCPVSPKEIIKDAGVTIECYNEKKFAEEVLALLNDKRKLKTLQSNAIKRARDFFENKIINEWIKLLKI